MRRLGLWIVGGFMAASLGFVAAQTAGGNSDEQEIRALYDRYAAAFRAKDVNAIMECYAPGSELFAFDLSDEGQHAGFEEYKKYYQEFFARFPGPIDQFEFLQLSIVVEGNLAYSHAIEKLALTTKSGSKIKVNLLVTDGLRKINGKWVITQEHVSEAPADPVESRKAAEEASAVASLRVINTACMTYSTIYGIGFPRKLSNLGQSGAPTPTAADLIDGVLASGVKSGYSFTYSPGAAAGGVTPTYTFHANPITPGQTGRRYFFTDQSGVIRVNTSRPATSSDPPLS